MEKEKLDSRLTQNCGPVKSPVDHTERRLALGNAARQFLRLKFTWFHTGEHPDRAQDAVMLALIYVVGTGDFE